MQSIPIPEQFFLEYQIFKNMHNLCFILLQPARDYIRQPITILSGYRSQKVNQMAGGSSNSEHLYGMAADITSGNNERLLEFLRERKNFNQLIKYYDDKIDFLHISYNPFSHKREVLECYLEANENGIEKRKFRKI